MITDRKTYEQEFTRIHEEINHSILSLDISDEAKSQLIVKYLCALAAVVDAWNYCHPNSTD